MVLCPELLVKPLEITKCIIAGLLMGDDLTGIVHHEMSEDLKIVTDVALGMIALAMGMRYSAARVFATSPALVSPTHPGTQAADPMGGLGRP